MRRIRPLVTLKSESKEDQYLEKQLHKTDKNTLQACPLKKIIVINSEVHKIMLTIKPLAVCSRLFSHPPCNSYFSNTINTQKPRQLPIQGGSTPNSTADEEAKGNKGQESTAISPPWTRTKELCQRIHGNILENTT